MRQREHPFTFLFHKDVGKCDRALLLLAFVARRLGDLQSGNYGNVPINIDAQIFSLNRNDFIWKSGAEFKEIAPGDLPARTSVNKVVRQNAFESARIPVLDRGEYLLFEKHERLLRLGQFFALFVRCGRQFNLPSSTSNDARNHKMALVALRRLLQRFLLSQAVLDLVGARGVRDLDLSRALMTPGFDRERVKLVELIDIFDDRRELIRKKLFLFGRQFQVGQRRDLFDFRLCDRHDLSGVGSREWGMGRNTPFPTPYSLLPTPILSKHFAAARKNCSRSESSLIRPAADISSASISSV